jgi:ABC-2 type transport system ATP-binding protein
MALRKVWPMNDPVIKLTAIVKTYTGFNLTIPELSLTSGKLHVLIGPNGAGKSTLLRLLIGLSLPDEGKVKIFGKLLNENEAEIKLHTGYAAADMGFPYGMRVSMCLDFVAGFYPQWSEDVRAGLAKSLELVEKKRFYQLSPGQQMRVLLVAAFARMPNLLLLDEPFATLDPFAKEKLKEEIVRFLRDSQNTVLLATNELADCESIIDELHIILNGRIIASGSPPALAAELCRFSYACLDAARTLPADFTCTGVVTAERSFVVAKGKVDDIREALIKAGAGELALEEVTIKDVMRYYFGG